MGTLRGMRLSGPAPIPRSVYLGALLAIVVLATAIRVYDLRDLPPGFFCDEASLGYNAYSILNTGRDEEGDFLPLYIWSFGVSYKNPLFVYGAVGPIAVLGLSEFSVRLTAALFGVLGVVGIALLGRVVLGPLGGLIAALLLALCPWHVHFSRIAFELISFLPLFLFAFAALVMGLRGRPQRLCTAAVLFGLCPYAYAPAKLFTPAFLAGATVVYARRLWGARGWALLAALVLVLTAAPAVVFDLAHPGRAGSYFGVTTSLDLHQSLGENTRRILGHYQRFFSPDFLFEHGDPIARHAVPGFGELYWSMAPLLLAGLLWALWPRNPEGKLFLWWLLLYPIAPSLMNEVPSASRGFIGVGAFCLLAASGAVAILRALRWLMGRWPRVATTAQAIAVAALFVALGVEAWRYGRAYVRAYPAQAAEDFQYGYREAIQFMESRRSDYDVLLLTANNVNQPQIFTAFYNATDPRQWRETQDAGYLITDPAEFGRYDMNRRILAALRVADLRLFEEYTELHRVHTPAGKVEYVIAALHRRRRFIGEWLLLGPFENQNGTGIRVDFVAPDDVTQRVYDGAFGPTYWRRVVPQFVRVDFNSFYERDARIAGRPNEWLCGYAVTQVNVSEDRDATLELTGAYQPLQAWVGGHPVTPGPVSLGTEPRRWPLPLTAGANELLLKVCKRTGDWHFTARITDREGHDMADLRVRAAVQRVPAPVATEPQPPRQLVDGISKILRFSQQSDQYSDYRGDSRGWWEHLVDPNGEVVWETDPCPARVPTVFAFTAMMSEEPGTAELWVNREFALTFSTGRFTVPQRWQRGAYVLEFFPREAGHYLSGYWLLHVPEQSITPGEPVELRVAHVDGSAHALFMIKERHDTAEFESIGLEKSTISP